MAKSSPKVSTKVHQGSTSDRWMTQEVHRLLAESQRLLARMELERAARMSAPLLHYSAAFWSALAGLHTHGIADAHAGFVHELWLSIAHRRPSEPDIGIDEGVKFSWMGARYYLEVEVFQDGRKAWYFRDATYPTGRSEGAEEDPVYDLPERFWECLVLAGREHEGR